MPSGAQIVLGIDPGLSRCGYGVVEKNGHQTRAIAAGVIRTAKEDELPSRLAALADEFKSLLGEFAPHVVAVERVFFQSNVRTAMSVGQASGLALAAAFAAGCTVAQYTPNEVKMAVTGYGSAEKDQVQRMVQQLLGLAVLPSPPDAADALALALCHFAHAKVPVGVAR